jgi:hypothetical protein
MVVNLLLTFLYRIAPILVVIFLRVRRALRIRVRYSRPEGFFLAPKKIINQTNRIRLFSLLPIDVLEFSSR